MKRLELRTTVFKSRRLQYALEIDKVKKTDRLIFSFIILRFPLYLKKCVAFGQNRVWFHQFFFFLTSYCPYPVPPALHFYLDSNFNFGNTLLLKHIKSNTQSCRFNRFKDTGNLICYNFHQSWLVRREW